MSKEPQTMAGGVVRTATSPNEATEREPVEPKPEAAPKPESKKKTQEDK